MKIQGKVLFFNDAKGFGFLRIETRPTEDIFVHYTNIVSDGFKTLSEDENVLFELRENGKGLQAFEVEKLK